MEKGARSLPVVQEEHVQISEQTSVYTSFDPPLNPFVLLG